MRKVLIVGIFAVLLAPLWFLVTGSLQDTYGILSMPPRIIPRSVTFDNYLWTFGLPVGRWGLNTLMIAMMTIAGTILVTVTTGYYFAFKRWRWKDIMWVLIMAGIMVPRMSMIVPLFVVMRKIGVSGTLFSAAFPLMYSPMMLYIARMYFETIPGSLLEAARIDGAGEWRILFQIIAPVSAPIVATVGVFSGMGALGDYLWQMLQLQRDGAKTLLIGLIRETMKRGSGDLAMNAIGKSMAVGVILIVPMLTIFLVANRFFITTLGNAVKE